jgi:poly(3-hydroxybutyrate) depolymerase
MQVAGVPRRYLLAEPEAAPTALVLSLHGSRSRADGEVTLWTSKGAGHTWPGGRMGLLLRAFLGLASKEIDASNEIWAFERANTADA